MAIRLAYDGMDAEQWTAFPETLLSAHDFDADTGTAIVSGEDYRSFIRAWSVLDFNGSWSPETIVEGDGALVDYWGSGDDCRNVYGVVGRDADGRALYAVEGWGWHAVADDE